MKTKRYCLYFIEVINTLILLGTMLFIWQQTKISDREYKIRNKPIVGIEEVDASYIIPEGDARVGKPISWDEASKEFFCDGKQVAAEGCVIKVKIKNFGTEPALDFNIDAELCIGDTSIKTKDPEFKNSAMMPSQVMFNTSTVSKQSLYDAFKNKKQIKLKYKFKYSDLTKRKDLFEYYAEILIWDTKKMSTRIVDTQILDTRF